MFLGDTCVRNAQETANLFGEYFQGVYVRDDLQEDFVVDSSIVLRIQLEEQGILALVTQKGPELDRISPLILKKISLVVKKALAIMFNLSLLSGVFPCVWMSLFSPDLLSITVNDKI
jgi:hypothetical protein